MTGRVFINYRRDDSSPTAGRLRDRLVQEFGKDNVFMDVESIPAGFDFVDYLKSQIASYDVFLVLIGPDWLEAKDKAGHRRIENPDDPVTMEITTALECKSRVVPVTIDGARPPTADELPGPIKPLARREAVDVRNTNFHRDVDSLIEKIGTRKKWWSRLPVKTGVAILILLVAGIWFYLPREPVQVPPSHKTEIAQARPPAQPAPPAQPPETKPPEKSLEKPLENPPEKAIAKYTVQENLDIYGQDIPLPDGQVGIRIPDIDACAARCDNNKLCVAFSFDRWKSQCYLKNKIITPLLDPRSVVAVKKEFEIPNRSNAPIGMDVVRDHRFGEQPFISRRVSDFQACRDACIEYVNCIAFTFLKAAGTAQNCQFFRESKQEYIDDASADSGYKRQSAQAPPPVQPAAPAQPPAVKPPEDAIAKFTVQQNRDINGQDILLPDGRISVRGLDINGCAARCDSNKSCVGFSLDHWNHLCYLKSNIVTSRLDPHSTIAVKEPYKIPNMSNAPIQMVTLRARNHRFRGQPQTSMRVTSFDTCKAACTDDDRCIAFSFLKNVGGAKNCEIFYVSEEGYFDDISADSGYKSQ